jgi:hypothetical protein
MHSECTRAIESNEGRTTVKKKRIYGLLIALLLALVIAVPASATKPTGVSGTRKFVPPPQNRVWRPAGNNCIVEIDAIHAYTGDLEGTSVAHWRIVSHGPCEENGPVPYKYRETISIKGTFTGMVSGVSGSFDFTEAAKNSPTGTGQPGITSRLVILSGTGGLANLHGRLDIVGVSYSGQIHFDPKP